METQNTNCSIIHQLLSKGEHLTLEVKQAAQGLPHSLWETYSAFANTKGGTIILGVRENIQEKEPARRYTITGVTDADKMQKDFWNTVNDGNTVSANILTDDAFQIIGIDGRQIIAITVPRADYAIRPIFLNGNPLKGTYKRNHEGDYHCSDQEIRMMLRDANLQGNDGMLVEYYMMDDIDMPTLEKYRNRFINRYPDHVFNNFDAKEFLLHLGGYVIDRKSGKEGLTMAGLLMFGKGLPIRERFSNLRMDYIDKSNLIGEQRYSDRLTYDGTWENNLFNFATTVLPRVMSGLPRPFKMDGIERDDDTLQHKAVREAMTNAIIHADLMIEGVLKVEKYDDRFVFTNPGLLKLPIEQIYAGGESKARNQNIQTMFRMIGFGENIGSGFPLILNAWNEKHWLRPELVEQPDLLQVKLVLHIEPANDNIADDEVNDKVNNIQLSENQKKVLNLIKEVDKVNDKVNDKVTTRYIAERVSLSYPTVQRILKFLEKCRLVERMGSDKTGYWKISSAYKGQ